MTDLLVIDDDESLTELLGAYFQKESYGVHIADDGALGLRKLFKHHPDLVILDVTMPEKDGWETLERIREVSEVPVIMLTSRSDERDVLQGFSLGADDYVTKPFSFAQLSARVKAVLSRSSKKDTDNQEIIKEGNLTIDLRTRHVIRGEELISLTPTELKLLTALMKRAGEVVSPEELVREVWGPQYAGEVGHVRRYIWHLRNKIEPDPENPCYVHNERGFGYRFQAP